MAVNGPTSSPGVRLDHVGEHAKQAMANPRRDGGSIRVRLQLFASRSRRWRFGRGDCQDRTCQCCGKKRPFQPAAYYRAADLRRWTGIGLPLSCWQGKFQVTRPVSYHGIFSPSRYSISAWLGKLAIVASMLDIYLEVTGANSFSYRASYICDTCNSIATPEQFTEQASWPACNPLHWACVVVERHRRHEAADTTFVPRQRDSQNPTLNWKEGQENCCVGS